MSPGSYVQDLRYALRMLRKNPGFTAVAVLTLALGIGSTTAIFSVVNAVLLRPLPFRDPEGLCLLTERLREIPVVGPSWQNFQDWRKMSQSFEGIAAARNLAMTVTGQGEPERVVAQMATADLLPLLGVSPLQGRNFSSDEDRAGGAPVVILGHGFWQRRFGAAREVLGSAITLDHQRYTVIGILPPRFRLIQPADVLLPLEPWAAKLPDDRNWHPGIIAIGRLKPGAGIEGARSEIVAIAALLEKQYPVYNTDVGANVTGLHDQIVQNVRPALLVLLGAVAMVLLIACSNVASLLLARGNARRREIAVRTAIGAGRWRILRQLLTESFVLALAGGIGGLVLAALGLEPLVQLAANSVPNVGAIGIDQPVLIFATVTVLLAGILFGLAPAFHSTKLDLRAALNDASRGTTGGAGQQRMRSILVGAEIAVTLVLLISAGLLLRSFERLQAEEPGFEPRNLLIADVPVSAQAYPKSARRMAFFDRLLDRARTLPGVRSAGAAMNLPVSGAGSIIHFNIAGRPPKTAHDYIAAGYRPVSAGYLETLGVPLLEGRLPRGSDTETGPFVAVVNRAMARRFFPGESPLGKHVQLGGTPEAQVPWMEVVGVVGDMKQNLATDSQAEMYVPYRQADAMLPVFTLSLVLRTAMDPRNAIADLRQAAHELDPDQPLVKIRTMEENISTNVSQPRFRTTLLCIFGLSALLLSIIGLYGLMVYSISQRVQEFGIRMTLGAGAGEIVRMVLGQGLRLALAGVAAGMIGAYALSRLLASFLYGVTAADPLTYGAVALLLIAVALTACWIPARRAMQIDPMVALRHE